jgi:hypothetical protein
VDHETWKKLDEQPMRRKSQPSAAGRNLPHGA